MNEAAPSAAAIGAARRRAAHQILDKPCLFEDPLAVRVLGAEVSELRQASAAETPSERRLRLFVAARSRFAEDRLRDACLLGVRQYVVLGAGLDTFGCRNPYRDLGLQVFEVDHPATQAWKRQRLHEVGIAEPATLTFVALDFRSCCLKDGLAASGFDSAAPAFFSWLGVTPYLEQAAVRRTLEFIASQPAGSAVVFDYSLPRELLAPEQQQARDALSSRVSRAGEPLLCQFHPRDLASMLAAMGFAGLEDHHAAELVRLVSGSPHTTAEGRESSAHVMHARV